MQKPVSKPVKPVSRTIEKLEPASSQDIEKNLKASFLKPSENKNKSLEQIFPIDKKPHQRSKKPLNRIEIVDVESNDADVTSNNIVGINAKSFHNDFLATGDEGRGKSSTSNLTDKIKIISSTENAAEMSAPTVDESQSSAVDKVNKNISTGLQKKVEEEIMETISKKLSLVDKIDSSIKFKKAPRTSVQALKQ